MNELEQIQSFISTADAATLKALESTITQTRAARVDAQNAALPEFPWVVGVQGHGIPAQVSRDAAITLLAAGSHRLYSPDGGKAE